MQEIEVKKIKQFQGHKECIYALASGDKPEEFFSGSGAGWIVKWNLANEEKGKLIATFPSSIFSLACLYQQNLLAVGLSKSGYYLLDLNKNEPFKIFRKDHGVFDFKVIPGVNKMLIAGEKGYLNLLDLESWEELKSIRPANQNARMIKFTKDHQHFVMGSSDGKIRIFNTSDLGIVREFKGHDRSVFSLNFTPGGRYLITGGRDAHLRIWDTENDYRLVNEIPAHYFTINDIAVSPNLKWFATASRDKNIKIWDLKNFELLKVIDLAKYKGHFHSVNRLIWTTYQDLLISAGDDKTIKVWKINEK